MSIFVPERFVFENVLSLIYVALSTVLILSFHCSQNFFFAHQKDLQEKEMSVFGCAIYCRRLHLCTVYTSCAHLQMYHWLNMLFCSLVCNVAPGAALVFPQSSHPLLLSDFLKVERGTGFPAAALSAWPALKSHHHQRKRALKCLELLSSGVPFTTLWKPQSPQPDNCSRCLDGIQIAAYSLHTVRMAQSPVFLLYSPPSPLSFALLLPLSHIYSFSLRMFPKCFC